MTRVREKSRICPFNLDPDGRLTKVRPPSKFCGNTFSHFRVILANNPTSPTNERHLKHNLPGDGDRFSASR